MNLSIVSGTYNRITHLQKMVESVRQSVRHNLSYEIVLVDGGSNDGTIQYCESQLDINLIQHGKLMGAVKAFNDGAFAAKGDYVILANDDIEFVEDSIYLAWLFMQFREHCGIGCFHQDRNDMDWHVERMPVVLDGKQSAAYYGQVCIVPRWLGDKVSWWCDVEQYKAISIDRRDINIKPLQTYAGDNELSSRVYELGYSVQPVPNARIHDNTAMDDLRKINNIRGGQDPRAVKGHHPDSWSWGRKWRNPTTNLVGAVIRDTPQVENPMEYKPRILYLPIYEPGWQVQKEQKRGLREALEKVGLTVEYDYMAVNDKPRMMTELINIIKEIRPTLVLTQLHNGDIINSQDIATLKQYTNQAKFVNWNGDYWPDQCLSNEGIELAKSFDLATSVNRDIVEKYQDMGINADYWQIGWEPDGVVNEATATHDIVFLASGYSKSRQDFVRWLKGLRIDIGLYGNGWPDGWSKGENLYNFSAAAGIYMGAKISLGDSQWPDSGFVSNRVMQALAAGGSVLAHQWFRGMEHLGLVDGETCIIWHTTSDLQAKINQYLSNEPLRAKVAENGQKLAFERHSFDTRVKELYEMIEPKAESMEDWRW